MDAMDRFHNKYVFTCPFSKQCIKAFLDTMHGIQAESLSLITMLELIKFIMHLGKGITDISRYRPLNESRYVNVRKETFGVNM